MYFLKRNINNKEKKQFKSKIRTKKAFKKLKRTKITPVKKFAKKVK